MTFEIINALVSAALQLAVVLIIAVALYPASRGRAASFGAYLGLTRPRPITLLWAAGLAVLGAFVILGLPGMRPLAGGENTVAGAIIGAPAPLAIALILIKAFLTTALSEEILFRGLIAKRLMNWLGFQAGNFIQAVMFGAVHLVLLLSPQATLGTVATIVGFTAVFGWISGFLNEKLGNGSIAPSWLMHGLANTIAYSIVVFG